MGRRRKKKQYLEIIETEIESLDYQCRGVSHVNDKAVFIDGALTDEKVSFKYFSKYKNYDEAVVEEVIEASKYRVEPKCAHFMMCGGCSLQHMETQYQIESKQAQLLEQFSQIGKVQPAEVLAPLTGNSWSYRRKARLGVRYVHKKEKVLVGFREKRNSFIAELDQCEILHPMVGENLKSLAERIGRLSVYNQIPQIEVAVADNRTDLIFRVLVELNDADKQIMRDYMVETSFNILIQEAGPDSIYFLGDQDDYLNYVIPEYDVMVYFKAQDFTQVNVEMNQQMVRQAMQLLDPQKDEVILDLFCGLGNFTMPIARFAKSVVGVEGDQSLIDRAQKNAEMNGLSNINYFVDDLFSETLNSQWFNQRYDKVLLDPPRSGAIQWVSQLNKNKPRRIVYVSCNPSTLARDADVLVNEKGYKLISAGVMDMFPHTTHVESMALFEI